MSQLLSHRRLKIGSVYNPRAAQRIPRLKMAGKWVALWGFRRGSVVELRQYRQIWFLATRDREFRGALYHDSRRHASRKVRHSGIDKKPQIIFEGSVAENAGFLVGRRARLTYVMPGFAWVDVEQGGVE